MTIERVRGLHWYDRDPETVVSSYTMDVGIAPHVLAERLSYEVPAGKIAMVEMLVAGVCRHTLAADDEPAAAIWRVNGESVLSALICDKTVGAKDYQSVGTTMSLFEGDILKGYTMDHSADATVLYRLYVKISQFTAFPLFLEMPKPDVQEPGGDCRN